MTSVGWAQLSPHHGRPLGERVNPVGCVLISQDGRLLAVGHTGEEVCHMLKLMPYKAYVILAVQPFRAEPLCNVRTLRIKVKLRLVRCATTLVLRVLLWR